MNIITTHIGADFDALAAMVAAQKLYPDAKIVFSGTLLSNVEEFVSLYRDALDIPDLNNIKVSKIRMLILVDTKNPRRLGKLKKILDRPDLRVHIYDHHPWGQGDIHGQLEVVEMVGATTTLLVEKIRDRRISITPLEATTLALGIYEDTGSLSFTSTTARDAEAVAFLLGQGANLAVVSNFLGRPLSPDQKLLLKNLLLSAEHHQASGVKFLLCAASSPEYVVDLAVLTHTVAEIERPDAIFTVAEMEDRIYIVGRSNVPQLDVGRIVSEFGGGGHAYAGSATVKGAGIKETADKLLSVIKEKISPPLTCAGIMSSPVKTVSPDTSIDEAGQIMLRYGHSGLPVIKEEKLAGVISRRDIEKAIHHGLGHAPVKGFMTEKVVWAPPDFPVAGVRDLMIKHDIGRVPIVHDGRLVGIVSRSDVLRTLHGNLPVRHRITYSSPFEFHSFNVKELMKKIVNPLLWEIMLQAGEIGQRLGCHVYAAGGVVRDILLGVKNIDLDLVVEGDGIALARALGERYGAQVRPHENFGTAEVIFNHFRIDVATSRVEFYEYPAALPQVESSSLRQDLYRRDFTINAMAIVLNNERFGDLIDYFGGRQDLNNGLVRVLHNLSFIEDPTRILRAVRFEQRYGFILESETEKFLAEAVRLRVLGRVSCYRILAELKYILEEPQAVKMLARLDELKVLPALFPGVIWREIEPSLKKISGAITLLGQWGYPQTCSHWLTYFIVLLYRLSLEEACKISARYHLSKSQKEKVNKTISRWREIIDQDWSGPAGELARLILALPRESYPLIISLLPDEQSRESFRRILDLIRESRPVVKGDFIKSLGYKPGPLYRDALDAAWRARLEGRVKTQEEEKNFIKEYLRQKEGI